MLRRLIVFLVASVLALSAFAKDEPKLRVVATVSPIASIFASIGGDMVKVSSIGNLSECACTYVFKPSQIASLKYADIFIYIDDNFESQVTRIVKTVKGEVLKLSSLNGLRLISENGKTNWHIWLDLQNAEIIATAAFHILVKMSHNNKSYFANNYTKFIEQIKALKNRMDKTTTTNPVYISNELKYLFANNPSIKAHFVDMDNASIQNTEKLKELIKNFNSKCIFITEHQNKERLEKLLGGLSVVDVNTESWSYVSGYDKLFSEYFNKMIYNLEHCK